MTADAPMWQAMARAISPPAAENRTRWEGMARPNQLTPAGDWLVWLILAGRGWGKTRTGAEDVAEYARTNAGCRIALVARTYADGRDVMVEGESGLLEVLGSDTKQWNRSVGELFMHNGSRFRIYTSEKPKQLRGPQHHRAWADEVAQWLDADKGSAEDTTWANLLLGLRLGSDPRVIATTTPKTLKLIRDLKTMDGVLMTRGTTYENLDNLAPTFRATVVARYEGTRLGRQELFAEELEEAPGALWTRTADLSDEKGLIQYKAPPTIMHRLGNGQTIEVPDFIRIIVACDPAVTSGPDADETGIIIGGLASDGNAYIRDDRTVVASPDTWARRLVNSLDDYEADRIVAEVNNGGDLVESVIRTVRRDVPYKKLHASRGKRTRAEPIAALYQQGRVFHERPFPELEDQMCTWEPGTGDDSPDRMDALVWCLTELMTTGYSGETAHSDVNPFD